LLYVVIRHNVETQREKEREQSEKERVRERACGSRTSSGRRSYTAASNATLFKIGSVLDFSPERVCLVNKDNVDLVGNADYA